MDNMEYIETYFNKELSPERKREFEQKIIADPVFAEDVAFYLSLKQAAAAEMKDEKERFKGIFAQYKQGKNADRQQPALLRKLWPWAAAAAAVLAGIIFGLNVWFQPGSPMELADKYMLENFQTLSVTMGKQDSLQMGLSIYNEGRLEEALKQFETIARNDTTFIEAKKYAGIVSLRLAQYDKAINYFSQVENTQLYANPGKFYHALTLIKRNRPGDTETAKQLLQQVVENDLVGKEDAEEWLKKW
jgi:tetratricopeptide (TPR) repeat protein